MTRGRTVTDGPALRNGEIATLVLFGRPASGKGTIGQRLTDSGYQACSTGQQMREWAAGPSPEQQALRETMAAGGYGSDELAVRIVREFILGLAPGSTGVILDGFPRDLAQLEAWLAAPIDHGIAVVVDTPEEVCRDRMLGRMICPACGWSDHAPAQTCVRCGAGLKRRADDGDAAVFDRRVHDYETRVVPVIEAWIGAGLPLIRLDGTRDVEAIAGELANEVARLRGG
jgi:adenylate kinase family enzyme